MTSSLFTYCACARCWKVARQTADPNFRVLTGRNKTNDTTAGRTRDFFLVFLALGLLLKFRTERSEIWPLTSSAQVRSQGFASWPRDPQAAREMPHRGGGTAGGGKGSSSVSFSQGREASFITKIKAQVGYKEHKVDLDAKVCNHFFIIGWSQGDSQTALPRSG